MSSNNLVLNRFFTQYVFRDLFNNQINSVYSTVARNCLDSMGIENNGEIINRIYKHMSKNYRNEYFYQNTLLNKLLLGRHSINTTTALTQVPIGKSKADFVMINGKAVVYEIKTELDNFDRLNTQIANYYKAFNHVYVVTCSENYEKISALLHGTPVGICILSDKNTLQFKKECTEYNNDLSYDVLFKVLRKKEFENIIQTVYGNLPQATPAFYYEKCFSLFIQIPMSILYEKVLEQLKRRNHIMQEYYKDVPYELKSLMYFFSATVKDYTNLSNFLNEKYRG